MQVFKFGGASVNSAAAVRNMAHIVRRQGTLPLVVVVSAMGKTTNLLEQIVPGVPKDDSARRDALQQLRGYHMQIVDELFADRQAPVYGKVEELLALLEEQTSRPATGYNYDYDQTVSYGELLSTTILSEYLNTSGVENVWVDVRDIIRTDANYREGRVDWPLTTRHVQQRLKPLLSQKVVLTQGFIAGTACGTTTTLGREGSDYSAAILSHCLAAEGMTIWKDVPGFLNADPKYFVNTVKMEHIPYNEAIELAYYGASVIHPKTVQPIQHGNIPLHIKSFLDPTAAGSVIGPFDSIEPNTPLYIFKNRQVLLSLQPKDFSFIAEENLHNLFALFAQVGIRVNLMQNSALSFSICVDHNAHLLDLLMEQLTPHYKVRYNEDLQLITIRYYTQEIIDNIVGGRQVLLQQRSRVTTQLVVSNED